MKIKSFPKTKEPRTLTEVNALIDLFDHLEDKIRDYHLLGNLCSQRKYNTEQNITNSYFEEREEIESWKADLEMWTGREESARINERNLFKIKRMIQNAFANGELEK